jgi:hypothetical protein
MSEQEEKIVITQTLVVNMVQTYPHWRKIILTEEGGLERILHFLFESHSLNSYKSH